MTELDNMKQQLDILIYANHEQAILTRVYSFSFIYTV